jgi:AhpD family alkylhydroperoxidase
MKHPVYVLPDAMQALVALSRSVEDRGVPPAALVLAHLRASQINGCSFCVDLHARELRKLGEAEERIWAVAAWREAPFYTDAERAVLALTEALTRVADRPDPVPDEVWAEATRHFDERAMAALLVSIATINVWNRLNAATRQPALGARAMDVAAEARAEG